MASAAVGGRCVSDATYRLTSVLASRTMDLRTRGNVEKCTCVPGFCILAPT